MLWYIQKDICGELNEPVQWRGLACVCITLLSLRLTSDSQLWRYLRHEFMFARTVCDIYACACVFLLAHIACNAISDVCMDLNDLIARKVTGARSACRGPMHFIEYNRRKHIVYAFARGCYTFQSEKKWTRFGWTRKAGEHLPQIPLFGDLGNIKKLYDFFIMFFKWCIPIGRISIFRISIRRISIS